ncbi:CMP/dCMP-type deaminase domain-containing protein [Phanerochaete sordida]|uniref:CMP/dCMP-type deaminase domain-containing protein n=1 Tax=Phanerochaete sordida TaxID=48140 RepID=A0A9P3G4G1_9APHY|nr:CMP/dCMP-type deaminase domain-containing protein [Phanerochaete sordida]
MNKSQYYLSQCVEAASKSSMCFTLGAVMVKGGKVISSGHNHHRPHYDGGELGTQGLRKPVSMHAEMHAIYNCTGMSPSFKTQVQAMERPATCQKQRQSRKLSKQAKHGKQGSCVYASRSDVLKLLPAVASRDLQIAPV